MRRLQSNVAEYIPDRLYLTWINQPPPTDDAQTHFFSIDHEFVYVPFHADFGPCNLAHVVLFNRLLHSKMESPALRNKRICLFTHPDDRKRANAAFFLCCYLLLQLKRSPEESYAPIANIQPPLTPFRDAGQGPTLFALSIFDCLSGLRKALDYKLLDLETFDINEYMFREKVENGDMNWIIPGKFLAFAGPDEEVYEKHAQLAMLQGRTPFRFRDLTNYFHRVNVGVVVRLNNKCYERRKFLEAGIDHVEMYFPDGSNPPESILNRFLELAETRQETIAVHCKAGLGRTGTLIAAYIMKHYRFTASEVIGYLRVMRPGSVVGPQQLFLQSIEQRLWQAGLAQQANQSVQGALSPLFNKKPAAVAYGLQLGVGTKLQQQAQMVNSNMTAEEEMAMQNAVAEANKVTKDIAIPVQPNKRDLYMSMVNHFKSMPVTTTNSMSPVGSAPTSTASAHWKHAAPSPILQQEKLAHMANMQSNTSASSSSLAGRYSLRSYHTVSAVTSSGTGEMGADLTGAMTVSAVPRTFQQQQPQPQQQSQPIGNLNLRGKEAFKSSFGQ